MSKGSRNRRLRGKKKAVGPHTTVARTRVYDPTRDTRRMSYGSDIKTSGGVEGVCALCMSSTSLLLSHVIPKWAFKWHKAEGGVIHHKPYGDSTPRMQDGLKHYLLCEPCEILLGDSENVLAKISAMQPDTGSQQLRIIRSGSNLFYIAGDLRHHIQRALFGIALKYHFAPSSSYQIHSDRDVEDVRISILNDSYPIYSEPFGIKWYNGTLRGANPRAYSGVTLKRSSNGASTATVSAGGIDWFIQLTAASCHFVDSSSPWLVVPASLESRAAWFSDWEDRETEIPDDRWGLEVDDSCPCGSALLFGECCQTGWLQTKQDSHSAKRQHLA